MAKPKPVSKGGTQRAPLLNAVEKVIMAADLQGKSGMEQAQLVVLKGSRLTAYNDLICISAPIGMDTGLELMVMADAFHKVLKGLPEEELEMTIDEHDNVVIKTASTEVQMRAFPVEGELLELINSLKLDSIKENSWKATGEDFLDALNLCGLSVSRDAANVAYNSIKVICDKGGTVYSTDTKRISRYKFKNEAKAEFLIPGKSAVTLRKFAVIEMTTSASWVHFRDADGLTFSARTRGAEFPDVDKFFSFTGETIDVPPELGVALDQILVFAPGDDAMSRLAKITFQKGKVVVAANDDIGTIKRTVSVPGLKAVGSNPTIMINPVFFMDILQRATKMKVGEGRAMFTTGSFDHVMKLPATAEPKE